MKKVNAILQIAQSLADERNGFFRIKGPGPGDHDTRGFISELRKRA